MTLGAAMKDSDENCRVAAFSVFDPGAAARNLLEDVWLDAVLQKGERAKELGGLEGAGQVVPSLLERWLKSDDKAALFGLASNPRLPIEYLERVKDRLEALNDDIGVGVARQTIHTLEAQEASRQEKVSSLRDALSEMEKRIMERMATLDTKTAGLSTGLKWVLGLTIFVVLVLLFARLR